jgi:hypothetical protein
MSGIPQRPNCTVTGSDGLSSLWGLIARVRARLTRSGVIPLNRQTRHYPSLYAFGLWFSLVGGQPRLEAAP